MDLRERTPGAPDGPAVRHPWERARAAFVLDRLRRAGLGPEQRVLDVGAGDGWLAAALARRTGCRVTCWDRAYDDEDEARLRAAGLEACRDAPAGPFDLALLLDVLEHADDDRALLRQAVERVRPGGRLLVTVPAWPALFSAHDRALLHRRRYTPSACRALLAGAGLAIDEAGGLFHGLLLARGLAVLAERVGLIGDPTAGVGRFRGGRAASTAIAAALGAEQRLSVVAARRGLELPGLSWFALCTRPAPAPEQAPVPPSWQSGSP